MRGATLELLDITYDGEEDSVTGVLSGGLGQLVRIALLISIMRVTVSAILMTVILVVFIITITIFVIATNHHW